MLCTYHAFELSKRWAFCTRCALRDRIQELLSLYFHSSLELEHCVAFASRCFVFRAWRPTPDFRASPVKRLIPISTDNNLSFSLSEKKKKKIDSLPVVVAKIVFIRTK